MWFSDEKYLSVIKEDPVRQDWTEWEAGQCFSQIVQKLPKPLRDRARVGTLSVREIQGSEGEQCWMVPIEGYPKILGPKNRITLFDASGKIFFDGAWGETTPQLVLENPKFFLWLPPREGQEKFAITDRAKGFFRLLRHKMKRGKLLA
jgi:hypothetical protein